MNKQDGHFFLPSMFKSTKGSYFLQAVVLKIYSYITFGSVVRLTLWLILSDWVITKLNMWSKLFGANAGHHGVYFLAYVAFIYFLRSLINYLWHMVFQRFLASGISEADYGGGNISFTSSQIQRLRIFCRKSSIREILLNIKKSHDPSMEESV